MAEPARTDLPQAEQCLILVQSHPAQWESDSTKTRVTRTRIWTLFPTVEKVIAKIPS